MPNFCVLPGQSALKIYGVGRLDRTVCGQLDGSAGYKCPSRHDDLTVIAGHIPRLRGNEAVYRGSVLNAFAEGNQSFRRAEFDRLNDIVAGGVPEGTTLKPSAS